MKRFYPRIPIALLAVCLYSTGCTAGSGSVAPPGAPPKTVLSKVPDSDAVEAFTHKAELEFPDYGEGKSLVSDRILDGFEAAPSLLVVPDGSSIRWGFKYKEATIQSVVISDETGRPKLLAAVDGMTWLTIVSGPPIDTMADYQQEVKHSGMAPSVTVFVHDDGELKAYFPLLKRWVQANLMGFNTDCSKPSLAAACQLAEQIAVPTTIYVIAADGSLRRIQAPDVKAATIPLNSFVQ